MERATARFQLMVIGWRAAAGLITWWCMKSKVIIWSIITSTYEKIRMPNASISARHHSRLAMFLCAIVVNAVNFTVFDSFKMYLPFFVPCLFVVVCPLVLWTSYWCRDLPVKAFPHVIYDARASEMFLNILIFAILVLAMLPLLLHGSVQDIAESLIVNVMGYVTSFVPVLDNHIFISSCFALYALAAAMITLAHRDQAEFTEGMRHMLLQNCGYAILSRSLVKMFHSRFQPPAHTARTGYEAQLLAAHLGNLSHRSFEDLIARSREREGPDSVARLLGIYARRLRYEEELVAQLLFLYHCRNDRHFDALIVRTIVELLGLSGQLRREIGPEFRLLPSIGSVGVSSLGSSSSDSQETCTTAALLRLRLRPVLTC